MCGPWSIGHVFSQEMVRLSNLDRARAIGMVQSGTSCHDVALTFGVDKSGGQINDYQVDDQAQRDRECQKIVPRVVVPERQHSKLTT